MTNFNTNDKVSWNSPQGRVQGLIIRKVTTNGTYEGLDVTASRDEPRYVVKSSTTGKVATHRPDSLSPQ